MKLTLPILLTLIPLTVFADRATDYKYTDQQLRGIDNLNKQVIQRMPPHEMQSGKVVTSVPYILKQRSENLFREIFVALPKAIVGKEDIIQVPVQQVSVLMDSETRGVNARSSADARTVSFFVGVTEDFTVGDNVIVGLSGGSVTMHRLNNAQSSTYTDSKTLDEDRKINQDARGQGQQRGQEAFQVVCERIYQDIEAGRITPTAVQLKRLSKEGMTPELASEFLAQRTVAQR